jgi:hypothetical protein
MQVLTDWTLNLDVDGVLRGQGADPAVIRSRSPRLVAVAEEALAEGLPLIEPMVAYERFEVESFRHQRLQLAGGHTLSGSLIAEHLPPAQHVIVMVCTVGRTLEDQASEMIASSTVRGLALDGVGSAAAEALATEACRRFELEAEARGEEVTIPLNPGMIGWPVTEGQAQIFAMLDTKKLGVELSPSAMMSPRKSLSLVIGSGPDVAREGNSCDYCNMRETCNYGSHYD